MAEAFDAGRIPTARPETEAPSEEPKSPILGIFDGTRLVAAATIHDLRLTWGAAGDAPTGGIAGVACTADQRGRGHVGRLLEASLREMHEAGQYLSGLYPFAYAFYRRYGWEWVGEKRSYTVPTAEIKASPDGKHLHCYEGPEARAIVQPIYDRFARRYRGMSARTEPAPDFWDNALKHRDGRTTYVQVYQDAATGTAEGYLTFRYPAGGDAGRVGDLFANTTAAYRALLSVLHYYGTQVRKVQFNAPADDPLPLHVMHHDLETKVHPLFMGRVVDAAAALAALRPAPESSGRAILRIGDGHCAWNNGSFAVTLEGGQVSVTPSSTPAGIALDIQALSQAYWGQPSLDRLRAGGRLEVTDETQYAVLSRLLPSTVCFLQDFF